MWRGCWWWPCVRRSIKAGDLSVFLQLIRLAKAMEPSGMHLPDGVSTVGTKDPKGCKRLAHVHVCFHNSSYYTSFELIRRVLLRCHVIRLVDFFERLARRHAGTAASRRGHCILGDCWSMLERKSLHKGGNGRCYCIILYPFIIIL